MDRRDLNRNRNYRRNNRRNEVKEQTNELKESFVKAMQLESSHTAIENAPDKTMKSLIVCDSSH